MKRKTLNRRTFSVFLSTVFATLFLGGCEPEEESPAMSDEGVAPSLPHIGAEDDFSPVKSESVVAVVRDTDGTDDGVVRLIDVLASGRVQFYRTADAPDGLIGTDDVVLLKINCQWAQRGGTNTDLLAQVARAVAAHPDGFTGEIVVADNGQAQYGSAGTGGSLDWDQTNSMDKTRSAQDVIDGLKADMRIGGSLWDAFTMTEVAEYSEGDDADGFVVASEASPTGIVVSYPKFTTVYGTRVSFKQGIWDEGAQSYDTDRLKIINLPVLKVHGLYQVTGAVKAYMGCNASRLTDQSSHNSVGRGGMGTLMAQTRAPALNIMDMIWVGVQRGPGITYETAVEKDMLASSTDPVALDWWCALNVLMPELENRSGDAHSADPDSRDSGTFGKWLDLTARELIGAGIRANTGESVTVFEG
jgi:uncharacterized protein (DUF362 family)